jgi:opacity protein-like surface antigen
MRTNPAAALAALLATAAPACAAGPYVSGNVGASFLQDADNSNSSPVVDVKSSYDPGWVVSGAAGYGFANGLRVEGEIGYRQVSLDQLKVNNDGGLGAALGLGSLNGLTTNVEGNETALSAMANAWYDVKTGTPFTPYVGGGVGLARVSLNNVSVAGVTLVDDDDVAFAYQLGAGVAYALTQNVALTLDYRFFSVVDATFTDASGSFSSEFHSHNVMVGARIGF